MKNLSLFIFFVMGFSASVSAQSVIGSWKTIDDETNQEKSIIRIFKATDGKIYGKVEKLLDTSNGENPVCKQCPDSRKNQPIIGMILIKELEQVGNEWKNGKILDPEKGKEYSCKLWIEDGKLQVRGYWGMFYRTQIWYRAN
jgi:uncharacterized protein (DUF2147 family)